MACRTAARLLCCAAALLASWTGVGSAAAQSEACILSPDKNNPSEQILRCGAELTITPAPGTVYHPAATGEDGLPPSVQLDSGALLIEFHAKDTAKDTAMPHHDFQILTPQVVASVRGTKWMMEVKPGQTSAVVLLGQVAIARKDAADAVMVGPGRGVDVTAADPAKISKSKNGSSQPAPIAVKRWAPARVKALLARFGQ
jgi:FecR protein